MSAAQLKGVDLNLLLALHALIEERHVTRAAQRMGVTQSAMSHALSRLRVMLDDPLLVRTPRGMIPTTRAQELAGPLGLALDQLEAAVARRPSFDPLTAKRTFRVCAADYAELALLPRLLVMLLERAPGVEVTMLPLGGDIPRQLEEGALDLAIGLPSHAARSVGIEVTEWPGVYAQHLFDDRFVCVVREGHPVVKRSLSIETYASLSHAVVSPFGRPGSFVDQFLLERGLTRRVAASVPHFLTAPMLVAATDLVATIPERVARTFASSLGLRVVPCPLPLADLRMHQLWHERFQHDPAHVWFRGLVAEAAHADPARRKRSPKP